MSDIVDRLRERQPEYAEMGSASVIVIPADYLALDAADEIERLRAENEKLREAGRRIAPYLRWTISEESPGHHPTMPSAVSAFLAALEGGE